MAENESPLEETSEYRADRLVMTFGPWRTIRSGATLCDVYLAGVWTGIKLEAQRRESRIGDITMYRVWEHSDWGWFAVRGEAVHAAIRNTFDPD